MLEDDGITLDFFCYLFSVLLKSGVMVCRDEIQFFRTDHPSPKKLHLIEIESIVIPLPKF